MEEKKFYKIIKILLLLVGAAVCLVIAYFILSFVNNNFNLEKGIIINTATTTLDIRNMTYIVSGEIFVLKNGKAENTDISGSATKNILMTFGEPVIGDLNGDTIPDAAVLLENNPGGSGSFFYAVLVLSDGNTFKPTNTMLLGDRIAPQTVEIQNGQAIYNFAERKAGEPFTTQPSIGKSVWVYYDKKTGEIGELVKNFEGESAISLTKEQAQIIAEKTCIKGGEALGLGTHNKGTQTWWFDANLNATKSGCNPACVVDEKTETAEINWRCTGLIVPQQ
jgi:hypothetical protein